jgi:hypothetical protein
MLRIKSYASANFPNWEKIISFYQVLEKNYFYPKIKSKFFNAWDEFTIFPGEL